MRQDSQNSSLTAVTNYLIYALATRSVSLWPEPPES